MPKGWTGPILCLIETPCSKVMVCYQCMESTGPCMVRSVAWGSRVLTDRIKSTNLHPMAAVVEPTRNRLVRLGVLLDTLVPYRAGLGTLV